MLSALRNFILRLRASRYISYANENGLLLANSRVRFVCKPNSRLLIGGKLVVGYSLPGGIERPTLNETLIHLGEGSILETKGDVYIAPGCSIMLGNRTRMLFDGGNLIAHNTTLLCNVGMNFGIQSQLSWGVTVIDDDGHQFLDNSGKGIRRIRKPVLIGERVGIQANVFIPSGVRVGNNSIVSSGVILRRDLPQNCIAYDEPRLRIREGYQSGL
jgi:acetyltransferase-like isoleucine patch superfamily enzyme